MIGDWRLEIGDWRLGIGDWILEFILRGQDDGPDSQLTTRLRHDRREIAQETAYGQRRDLAPKHSEPLSLQRIGAGRASYPISDYQYAFVKGNDTPGPGPVVPHLGYGRGDDVPGFSRGPIRLVGVHPGALLADVDELEASLKFRV